MTAVESIKIDLLFDPFDPSVIGILPEIPGFFITQVGGFFIVPGNPDGIIIKAAGDKTEIGLEIGIDDRLRIVSTGYQAQPDLHAFHQFFRIRVVRNLHIQYRGQVPVLEAHIDQKIFSLEGGIKLRNKKMISSAFDIGQFQGLPMGIEHGITVFQSFRGFDKGKRYPLFLHRRPIDPSLKMGNINAMDLISEGFGDKLLTGNQ